MILKIVVPNTAPIIPVIITKPIAKDGIAPISFDVIIAIGAVIDLVVIDKIVRIFASKSHNIVIVIITVEKLPINKVIIIGKNKDLI